MGQWKCRRRDVKEGGKKKRKKKELEEERKEEEDEVERQDGGKQKQTFKIHVLFPVLDSQFAVQIQVYSQCIVMRLLCRTFLGCVFKIK